MTRIRTNRMSWVLGCCAFLGLAACSGPDPGSDAPDAPTASAPSDGPTEPAAPTADEPETSDGESSTVSAAALCDYLAGQLPELRAIGSEVGAMANLTVNLFTWYDNQGAVPDGTELDALTQQECPEVGTEALTLAGVESFSAL